MSDREPRIELLVGMIASGKSSYARMRAEQGALVISHDDLTAMLHGSYRYEPGLRECYRRMEEDLCRRGILHGRDVVIDRTHLTRESRYRWERWVAGSVYLPGEPFPVYHKPEVHMVTFPTEPAEVHARRRFEADPRGRSFEEWLAVANHHADQAAAEPLSTGEGFSVWSALSGPPPRRF